MPVRPADSFRKAETGVSRSAIRRVDDELRLAARIAGRERVERRLLRVEAGVHWLAAAADGGAKRGLVDPHAGVGFDLADELLRGYPAPAHCSSVRRRPSPPAYRGRSSAPRRRARWNTMRPAGVAADPAPPFGTSKIWMTALAGRSAPPVRFTALSCLHLRAVGGREFREIGAVLQILDQAGALFRELAARFLVAPGGDDLVADLVERALARGIDRGDLEPDIAVVGRRDRLVVDADVGGEGGLRAGPVLPSGPRSACRRGRGRRNRRRRSCAPRDRRLSRLRSATCPRTRASSILSCRTRDLLLRALARESRSSIPPRRRRKA